MRILLLHDINLGLRIAKCCSFSHQVAMQISRKFITEIFASVEVI